MLDYTKAEAKDDRIKQAISKAWALREHTIASPELLYPWKIESWWNELERLLHSIEKEQNEAE